MIFVPNRAALRKINPAKIGVFYHGAGKIIGTHGVEVDKPDAELQDYINKGWLVEIQPLKVASAKSPAKTKTETAKPQSKPKNEEGKIDEE